MWQVRNQNNGFTLIEMTMVLVIAGIIISIVATVVPSLIKSSKIKKAQALVDKVDFSLQGYISSTGRCPCPDTDDDGFENRNNAGTAADLSDDSCDEYVGKVPYMTLGLSSAEDAWTNIIKYSVYEDLIRTTPNTGTSPVCTGLENIVQFYDPQGENNPPDTGKLHTTDMDGNTSNKAYVLVSGGAKDLDGDSADGFFDGRNEGNDLEFDVPNRIIFHGKPTTERYDDIVLAASLSYLHGNLRCGTGGAPGGGTGSVGSCTDIESINCGTCDDGEDNDGDNQTDCEDGDCASHPGCTSGDCQIVTEGPSTAYRINETYSMTLTLSAGCECPCEWDLISDGGFTDSFLNPFTGDLSGTISQCPNAAPYKIRVGLEDSDTPVNEPTKEFDIRVESNLEVIKTSGGLDITWSSPLQEESFQVTGGHIGSINWHLDTGGANGFEVISTGEDSCIIKKEAETTTGAKSYSFTLTATDESCTTTNSADITLVVTVETDGLPAPYTEGMQAQWRFDECTTWNGTDFDVVDALGATSVYYGKAMGDAHGTSSGKFCRAAYFDGDDKIISRVLTGDDIMVFNDEVTLSCWFKSPGGGGAYPRLIEFSDASGSYDKSTAVAYDTDGAIRAWVTASGGGSRHGEIDTGSLRYADNKWHHVVYTYENLVGGKLYIDGVLKQSSNDGGTGDIQDAETFVMGGYYPANDYGFLGAIDEVMVFSEALSESEVTGLFAMTRPACAGDCYSGPVAEFRMENFPWGGIDDEVVDSGSSESHGKAALQGTAALPTQTSPSAGKVCRSGSFIRIDQTNGSYLDFDDPADGDLDPGTDAWTISCWFNWDGSSGRNIIYNKEDLYEAQVSGGYVQYAWQPHWNWDGGTSFPVSPDTWYYFTLTYDGIRQTMYKDGVAVYSRAQSGDIGFNNNKLLVGARGSTNPFDFFGGKIDEMKIYNRALADNEINADMTATRNCTDDTVIISTAVLPDATVGETYNTTMAAIGGDPPYGWELLASDIPGLSIGAVSGELFGTIDVCGGTHTVMVKVTDASSQVDERLFNLTVANGTFSVSPSEGQTFTCDSDTFYQDFSVSGPRIGSLTDWQISWLGGNPGGFEVISTGEAYVRFRKIGQSNSNNEQAYRFRLTAKDSGCASNELSSGLYDLIITSEGEGQPYYSGLVGEWRLDECLWNGSPGEVLDQQGGFHGTAIGNADSTGMGKICRAGLFDGSGDYVTVPDNAALQLTEDLTLSLWVRVNSGALDWVRLAGKGNSTYRNYGLWLATNGTVLFQIYHDGGYGQTQTSVRVDDGQWHHVAGVYDKTNSRMRVYVDQVERGSTTYSQTPRTSNDPFTVGYALYGTYLNGQIDEVLLFDDALDSSEIQALYTLSRPCQETCHTSAKAIYRMDEAAWNGTPNEVIDGSGNAFHGTSYHGSDTTVEGKLCRSAVFTDSGDDNINDRVELPNNMMDTVENFTIAVWIKSNLTSGTQAILSGANGSNNNELLLYLPNLTTISTYLKSGSNNYAAATNLYDAWHHLVWIREGNQEAVYLNNMLLGTNTVSDAALDVDPGGLWIGSEQDSVGGGWQSNQEFVGLIDEIRFYNRALSENEIAEIYNAIDPCQ